jgi:murein DD-endopeptidase MepM/ murein hydrolase activator NlpD
MSGDQIGDLPATTPATGAVTAAGPAPNKAQAQIKQLAQEFEAMLMTQMLRDMRRSMLSDESSEGGYGAHAMSDTMDVEFGRALGRAGGFGLTSVLLKAIQRQTAVPGGANVTAADLPAGSTDAASGGGASAAVPVAAPPPPATMPAAAPSPSGTESASAPKGPVTSAFGWRRDPFTGATQFHSGVDIGLAYGTPVRAAAGGQVVFAGPRGGYGNVVVVEQPSGQQMRYAHLSAQTVHAGDTVETGQVIGQVGDTGRATGAHLHFEVLENGRAVDPAGLD